MARNDLPVMRLMRQRMGMSQTQLAARVGCTQIDLSTQENAEVPILNTATLHAIADTLYLDYQGTRYKVTEVLELLEPGLEWFHSHVCQQ